AVEVLLGELEVRQVEREMEDGHPHDGHRPQGIEAVEALAGHGGSGRGGGGHAAHDSSVPRGSRQAGTSAARRMPMNSSSAIMMTASAWAATKAWPSAL